MPSSGAKRFPAPDPGAGTCVWMVDLDRPGSRLARLEAMLSPDEHRRAARFRSRRDRDRFVVARATLRTLLSHYCSIDPAHVAFASDKQGSGKPVLAGSRYPGLHFNVTHSDRVAAIAIGSGPVGVDVEKLRDIPDALGVAERFFAPPEREAVVRTPAGDRSRVFLQIWTCKEAYLKGIGVGLQAPLRSFDAGSVERGPGEIRVLCDGGPAVRGWRVYPFVPEPGFIGALASPEPLRSFQVRPAAEA